EHDADPGDALCHGEQSSHSFWSNRSLFWSIGTKISMGRSRRHSSHRIVGDLGLAVGFEAIAEKGDGGFPCQLRGLGAVGVLPGLVAEGVRRAVVGPNLH